MEMILSPNRTIVTSPARKIDVIVIHDMESPEGMTTAEDVARNWFAKSSVKASAHYNVDGNSAVQCVPDKDVAWAAPGANHNGLQIELAGKARQTVQEWADAYSSGMLARAAALVAVLCKKYNIPASFVNENGLLAGRRGITTHNAVSLAYKRSDHSDPGPNFPMAAFVAEVQKNLAPPVPKKFVVFQIVNNGKVLAESLPSSSASEQTRLAVFLSNRSMLISSTLLRDPDASVTIRRVTRTETT
ncbi:MAG: N-acetylmuramoyl-L-alanine amidase [Actinobacteria bacterium]|nr:N-acetylmuramoyl-L-alanine amidase [Actinomycetota bacterium]